MRVIYDEEIYANYFLLGAKDVDTNTKYAFEISPWRDDRHDLLEFVRACTEMIGFNNINFDYPLLHYFLTELYPKNLLGRQLVPLLMKRADLLIHAANPHKNIIRRELRPQVDLFKIHHYDNKARQTSLKALQFNLRLPNVQELPYTPGSVLTQEQAEKLKDYCLNSDVEATHEFYLKSSQEIELRKSLSELYRIDATNYNDGKIGKEIFKKIIQQKLGIERIGKTPRESINIGDVIFNYVAFNSVQFSLLLEWLKQRTITQTKGVFTQLPFDELTSLEGYYKVKIKKGCQENLNIVYKGFQYDFGVGGIHGSIAAGIYEADEDYAIIDIDVSSYYPNLGIQNHLFPQHLSPLFCDIYEGVYNDRKKYPKKSPGNEGLKKALNCVYGCSNEEFSPFYDPQYTMAITINGQLLLCMLSEKLVDTIPDIQMLQINTDGMTVRINRKYVDQFREICKRWENYTKLELEEAQYQKMVIRDVNSYSALRVINEDREIDPIKDIKRKGVFSYRVGVIQEKEWHKDHSALVVPRALERYFYFGELPEEFIPNWTDTFDFFKRVKLPKKYKLVGRKVTDTRTYDVLKGKKRKKIVQEVIGCVEQIDLPNVTRYIVAKDGWKFLKIMPPLKRRTNNPDDKIPLEREQEIEADFQCLEFNDIRQIDINTIKPLINFDYYIGKAKATIEVIETHAEVEEEIEENEEA